MSVRKIRSRKSKAGAPILTSGGNASQEAQFFYGQVKRGAMSADEAIDVISVGDRTKRQLKAFTASGTVADATVVNSALRFRSKVLDRFTELSKHGNSE